MQKYTIWQHCSSVSETSVSIDQNNDIKLPEFVARGSAPRNPALFQFCTDSVDYHPHHLVWIGRDEFPTVY
jgi:hypothetical protein